MNPREKILIVLDKINDAKEISPKNARIHLNYFNDFEDELSKREVDNILKKLEKDEKIISDYKHERGIEYGTNAPICEYYFYVISDKFNNYYNNLKKVIDINKESNSHYISQRLNNKRKDIVYEITYNDHTNEITINDRFILTTPQDDSENKYFFKYVYENPNKYIRLKNLKSEVKRSFKCSVDKRPHHIINDLGFKGDIHKAFFKITQKTVFFRNPVTQEDLDKLGIRKLKIRSKSTKKISHSINLSFPIKN